MATLMDTQLFSDTQKLSRSTGPSRQARIPDQIPLLRCDALTLGRTPGPGGVALQSCQFPGMISRKHASIRHVLDTSQWVLKDLDSTNGVHINNVRIPRNINTPIEDGDTITFGLNLPHNELKYRAQLVESKTPALNRIMMKARASRLCQLRKPQKRPRSLDDKQVSSTDITPPNSPISKPNMTTRSGSQSAPSACVPASIQSGTGSQGNESQNTRWAPSRNVNSPPLSSEEILEPPAKKVFTIDSLFDSKQDTSEKMDEAIFGKMPSLTPRARTVLMGVKVSAVDIQVQIARDEVEREKNKIKSKYKHLKSQLALKDQILKEKEKTEEKISEAVEEEFICAICQELFIRSMTLPCSHSFCEWCIQQWLNRNSVCPVCRTTITQKPIRSVAVDNVIKRHVANLSQEQQTTRDKVVRQHYKALGLPPPPVRKPATKGNVVGSVSMPIVLDSPVKIQLVTISDSDSD